MTLRQKIWPIKRGQSKGRKHVFAIIISSAHECTLVFTRVFSSFTLIFTNNEFVSDWQSPLKSRGEAQEQKTKNECQSQNIQTNKPKSTLSTSTGISLDSLLAKKCVPERPLLTCKRAHQSETHSLLVNIKVEARKKTYVNTRAHSCAELVIIANTCLFKRNPFLPNSQIFCPGHFANYTTIGVVYMLCCDCGYFSIGRTKLEFWRA